MVIALLKNHRRKKMTNREILLDLWKKVNECEDIPFSENSYLNEDNENMMLLDDLVMISIIGGAVIMSYRDRKSVV